MPATPTVLLTRRALAFAAATLRLPPLHKTPSLYPISNRRPAPFIRFCAASPPSPLRPTTTVLDPTSSTPAPGVGTRPNVIDVLQERGLFDNSTCDVAALRTLCSRRVGVYTGFDPTADSLHLGNLLAILALAWFQRCGHQVVALVGGATGKVGDPSGKSAERPVMDDETIATNLSGIEANLRQVLDRSAESLAREGDDGLSKVLVLNNDEWVGGMSFLGFLRDVGKYARVNTMMAKDSVRSRLDSDEGMSYTEFTYQLLQAYDFMHLSDVHDVTFQLGGSDQWGNITAGTELTRKLRSRTVHGITFPLLTTSDGKKFGKSEKGAVWLTWEKLSPYQLYQFLVGTPDEDVVTYLRKLTFLPLEEVDRISQEMDSTGYVPNTAQKRLAEEVTRIVHGNAGVDSALAATAAAAPGSAAMLSVEALEAIAADMPSTTLSKEQVIGVGLVQLMTESGLQKTKGEARRLIKGGGAYLNNRKVPNEKALVAEEDLVGGRLLLLAAGKKNKLLVRIK